MHPLHILPFLIPSIVQSIKAQAVNFQHEFTDNNLLDGCKLNLGERTFDICPIIPIQTSLLVPAKYHKGLDRYTIGLSGLDPQYSKCPNGTWICLTETRFGNGHEIPTSITHTPVAGKTRPPSPLVDQGTNAIASVLDEQSPLNLFLIGGFNTQERPQYGLITFVCARHKWERSQLTFSGFDSHTSVHSFVWRSRYACPTINTPTSLSDSELLQISEDEAATPPPESDEKEEEHHDDLIQVPSRRIPRRWAAVMYLITGAFLFFVLALFSSQRLRIATINKLQAVRGSLPALSIPTPWTFRVGESKLVRWAREDESEVGLLDATPFADGEEDEMVNQVRNGGRQEEGRGEGEYIPMKSAPQSFGRKSGSGFKRNYGTTGVGSQW